MKRMLNDIQLQKQFEEDGYVVVPFLNKEEIKLLLQLYEELKEEHDVIAPVHSTSDTNKPDLIRKVDKEIRNFTKDAIRKIFFESKIFLCNFLVKESGEDSVIFPHHDWTFVDESCYASVSVWCPLIDVTAENGYIRVLRGSHRMVDSLRASPDSPFAFGEVIELVENYMQPIPMKGGEALIYHHALIHASSQNLSGAPRPVVVLGVVPEEAELYLYYLHPGPGKRTLEKFGVDTEFFFNYEKHSRPPRNRSLGTVRYEFKKVSREEFLKFIASMELPEKPISVFERMMNILKR